jgi:predicted nucleotidyltransferase
VDLLFTFDYDTLPVIDAADVYFDFIDKAEALLQRSVDLVSEPAIENPYLRKSIDEDKVLLYEV